MIGEIFAFYVWPASNFCLSHRLPDYFLLVTNRSHILNLIVNWVSSPYWHHLLWCQGWSICLLWEAFSLQKLPVNYPDLLLHSNNLGHFVGTWQPHFDLDHFHRIVSSLEAASALTPCTRSSCLRRSPKFGPTNLCSTSQTCQSAFHTRSASDRQCVAVNYSPKVCSSNRQYCRQRCEIVARGSEFSPCSVLYAHLNSRTFCAIFLQF